MTEKRKLFCSSECGIETWHTYKSFLDSRPTFSELGNGSNYSFQEKEYLELFRCENCSKATIEFSNSLSEWQHKPLSRKVPENIRKTYDEANLVRRYSPRASCTLLRICLEEILIEASNSLYDAEICYKVKNAITASRKIEILKADKNAKFKLDDSIWDFAFSVKELGNDNSHAIQKIPDSEANETFQSLCLFIEEIANNLIYKLDLKQRLEAMNENIKNQKIANNN